MVVMIERPWRCDVTGNPVGTDTRMVGAPPCDCQGCRAEATITGLSAERDHYAASELAGVEKARELFKRLESSEAEATSLRRWLGELLAVIHRDGGHYQDFAGTEQAVADAQSAVVLLFQAQDERNDLRRKLEEAKRQRDEVIRKSAAYNPTEREGRAIMDEAAALERAEAAERKLEEHRKALEELLERERRRYEGGPTGQKWFRRNNAEALAVLSAGASE